MKRLQDMTEPELQAAMSTLATAVELTAVEICGIEKPLFVLLLFDRTHVGQYVSNCSRKNMAQALREAADRLDKEEDLPRGNRGEQKS